MRLCAAARKIIRLPLLSLPVRVFLLALIVHCSGALPRALAARAPGLDANPAPQEVVVQRVDFVGNRRIRSDTLKARIFTRDRDAYNEETLRRDFQALWNTQFFEDIRLEVEDSPDRPNAKILVFHLKERTIIRRI